MRTDGPPAGVCKHWTDGVGYCWATDGVAFFTGGYRCPAHRPAVVNGRTEPVPDPARTLTGLREAAGLPPLYAPPLSASHVTDDRAIASGKRRSNQRDYREARAREEQRRKGA